MGQETITRSRQHLDRSRPAVLQLSSKKAHTVLKFFSARAPELLAWKIQQFIAAH